ncbi:hypothetical protein CCHL11_02466 [Colletotrichum chlorophyti]|uniref:Uncharacterized protein n=1 Tax=Colletotrichum chlorophyti TaxID=708187 RepID=A0A1Q8S654_9PEZI|nr:hypothetical protein CCHL11_02466 [Colletotrichum chlorophyti]
MLLNYVRDVYNFGWVNNFKAAQRYTGIGHEVKRLAESLDVLGRVVDQAIEFLRRNLSIPKPLRWDPSSLGEIVGDYRATLDECFKLLSNSGNYQIWNVLMEPVTERLQARIALHNSKVLYLLKPFERDLLCRIREDMQMDHRGLAQRIQSVHSDLLRLTGVLIPDLEHEIDRKARREFQTLEIPLVVYNGLEKAWQDRPDHDSRPSLQEMTDAFCFHFDKSTVHFNPLGILVDYRKPPLENYINLLKCVWLKKHITKSPKLNQSPPDVSHWPSFVQELEDNLSTQCARFNSDLVTPSLAGLTTEMLNIWPERAWPQRKDFVRNNALIEQVLDVALQGYASHVQRKLQVLRRPGAHGELFRITIVGTERGSDETIRRQIETFDFDVSSVILTPRYAVPSNVGRTSLEMVLRMNERIARLSFLQMRDIIDKLQLSKYSGFCADKFARYNVTVSFFVSGRSEPLIEKACVQLWVPKRLDGQLMVDDEALVKDDLPSSLPSESPESSNYDSTSERIITHSALAFPKPFTANPGQTVSIWNTADSLGAASSRSPFPPSVIVSNDMIESRIRPPMAIPPRPVRSGSGLTVTSASTCDSLQANVSTSVFSPRSSALFPGSWQSNQRASYASTVSNEPDGTFGVPSSVSTKATSSNNSYESSNYHPVTVDISEATGTVNKRPPRPMIILFTQDKLQRLALVAVDIDQDIGINPGRCNCRRPGRDGASCPIASIECNRGRSDLSVRRFENRNGDTGWNLANLALGRRGDDEYAKAAWKDVRRISLEFSGPEERARFGGTPGICRCETQTEAELLQCLKQGHKGYLGLVREFERQQLNEYHQARREAQKTPVGGMRDGQ